MFLLNASKVHQEFSTENVHIFTIVAQNSEASIELPLLAVVC